MQGFVPSWIQPADEVGNLARGYQIGMSIGARQAEQAFREQQAMRQQQLEAQDKARWEAEFGLRAKQASDRATAIRAYQSDLASGMDPVQAIIKHGPGIGQQGSVEAAALRSAQQRMTGGGLTGGLQDIGGGFKAFQTGPNTRTLVRPSETATGELIQATTPDGKPLPGTFVTPKGQIVHTPKTESVVVKARQHTIDARRKSLQHVLDNEMAFSRAVEAYMTQHPDTDKSTAQILVQKELEYQIKKADRDYELAGQETGSFAPPATSGRKLVYRGGKIVEE